MNPQHHRQLQQARQRVARNRRAVQGDVVRACESVKSKLNWRLQSQQHPIAMLLGAAAVGVIGSRLLSNVSGGQGWQRTLLRWAKSNIGARFWRQMLDMLMAKFQADASADDEDESPTEAAS